MEYWVAMNKTELKVALLLLNKTELPGVIQVEAGFTPDKTSLDAMVSKGFLQKKDNGTTGWSPFVKMVMWTAVNPESVYTVQGPEVQCRIYFHGETMVLGTRDQIQDLYFFYYVPLIPKAIGGLASFMSALQQGMLGSTYGKRKTVSVPADADENARLVELLPASKTAPVSVDGWCMGEHTLEQALVQDEDGYWLAQRDGDTIVLDSMGFYDFIQSQTDWIAGTHGKSIARKEETDNG